jgi:hypothetical protein
MKSKRQTSQKRAARSMRGSPHEGHAEAFAPADCGAIAVLTLCAGIAVPHTEQ